MPPSTPSSRLYLQLLDVDAPGAVRVEEVEGLAHLLPLLLRQLRLGARLLPLGRGRQRRLLEAGGLGEATREKGGASGGLRSATTAPRAPSAAPRAPSAAPRAPSAAPRSPLTIPAAAASGRPQPCQAFCPMPPLPIG